MVEFDVFRQDLATLLLCRADRRRHAWAGSQATGEDLKIIALLEQLAADVENLDMQVFLVCRAMLTHKRLARRYLRRRDELLAQIGVTYWPVGATDLVRWISRQTLADDPEAPRQGAARAIPAPPPRSTDSPYRSRSAAAAPRSPLGTSVAADFCAGFGIVAPMLALWEVGVGVGQWRDNATATSHPSVPASVVAADPIGGDRSAGLASTVVLNFQPTPAATSCQVSVRVGFTPVRPEVGTTLMVVPRSANCEPPLIAAELGDPLMTFGLAAALLAGGIVALKMWSGLSRRSFPSQAPARARRPYPALSRLDGAVDG